MVATLAPRLALNHGADDPVPLRDYQREALDAAHNKWLEGVTRQILQLPCGAGKTILAAYMAHEKGIPTVMIVHRDELANQTIAKFSQNFPSLSLALCKAEYGRSVSDLQADVVVASAQTIAQPKRLATLVEAVGEGGLTIVDEAHHSASDTWARAIEALNPSHLVGLTATPIRTDNRSLGAVYDEIVYQMLLSELVNRGILARPIGIRIGTSVDLSNVRTRKGNEDRDFVTSELEVAVNTPERNALIVAAWRRHAWEDGRKRTIAFCVDVNHARQLCDAFRADGVAAEFIVGTTPTRDRERIYRQFREGEVNVITSVGVLTEGWDEPSADCALMCAPTQSQARYIQCLDLETEVLTRRGFMGYEAVMATDEVAALVPGTAEVRWVPIQAVMSRPVGAGERMVTLKNPSLDIRVTEGHRMLASRRITRDRWQDQGFIEAGQLVGSKDQRIPVSGEEDIQDCELSDAEIRFLGWFLTDGTLGPENRQLMISQAKHQPQLADLERCLNECGFRYGRYERQHEDRPETTMVTFAISYGEPRVSNGTGSRGWADLERWVCKDLTPEYERLSARQFGLLLEGMHGGNGIKQRYAAKAGWQPRSLHICTGRKVQAERLQALAVRRGWRVHVTEQVPGEGQWGSQPIYMLHLKHISTAHVQGRPSDSRPTWQFEEPEPFETVWCVENELSTLVIRRNGKVAIVGNCAGRVLRKWPGKSTATIIDFVDITAQHGLQTIVTLAHDDEETEAPLPGQPQQLVGEQDRKDGEAFDLFAVAGERVEKRALIRKGAERMGDLLTSSRFQWSTSESGKFITSLGDARYIAIVPVGSGFVPVHVWASRDEPAGYEVLFKRPVDPETAMGVASQVIEPSALVDRNARWRMKPATEKQLALAHRMNVRGLRSGMTAGEVGDLLTLAMFEKSYRRAGLHQLERELGGKTA